MIILFDENIYYSVYLTKLADVCNIVYHGSMDGLDRLFIYVVIQKIVIMLGLLGIFFLNTNSYTRSQYTAVKGISWFIFLK